jgi:excisionase family DNA binding protein
MHADDRERPCLSTPQVADELGVTEATVRALVAAGKIRAWRFNRWYKFSRAALDEFKSNSEVRPRAA